jgi:hypothetical protein
LKAPIIGNFLAWISAWIELKWVHPDDEVMLHKASPQHPVPGSYHLIHADKGVALWLQHMQKQTRQESLAISETEVTTGRNGQKKHAHSSTR